MLVLGNVRVTLRDGQLRAGPPEAITPEVTRWLREHRDELLAEAESEAAYGALEPGQRYYLHVEDGKGILAIRGVGTVKLRIPGDTLDLLEKVEKWIR